MVLKLLKDCQGNLQQNMEKGLQKQIFIVFTDSINAFQRFSTQRMENLICVIVGESQKIEGTAKEIKSIE